MSEDGDFTPASWATSDFASARRAYDASAGRSYSSAVSSGKTLHDMVPESLTTNSTSPLVILCDETGSMGEWPAVIFSKLPYLVHEVSKFYLNPDTEICFGAIGDARNGEKYPLQLMPFGKDEILLERLKSLIIEHQGGGQGMETYELGALYLARNVSTPEAQRLPIAIVIGDEAPYPEVTVSLAADIARVKLDRRMSTSQIFEELKQSWSVYMIHKNYDSGYSRDDASIQRGWENLLGADHVVRLPEPGRVVDVIFGILAKETDKAEYFRKELTGRQRSDQVRTVLNALKSIDIDAAPSMSLGALASGKSVIPELGDGKKSKPLL